ncbi:universal stress protein [Glycomyces sp. MUSA5-2]|uniref:universal stress protein n=1 Tax=Glycomyces sp. MUSA5-2 TaxID=2053002 RepID=UPI00300A4A27
MEAAQERVIVGVDGSEASVGALRWAIRYAERTGATVDVVYVWQVPALYGDPVRVLPGDRIAEAAQEALRATVDRELGGRTSPKVRCIPQGGYPSQALVERSAAADLLVVGNRGLGGFKGVLLGSVSLRCVSHAACPVVVVRSPD